ncbi:MAG: ATPase [Chloroflexi bacterium]|nr:MAG: ATPase [Chloroflexota bacterium]
MELTMANPVIVRKVPIDRAAILVMRLIKRRHAVHLWGKPGIGKSEVVHQIGALLRWKVIEFRANLRETVDLRGIPVADMANGTTKWLVPDELPRADRDGEFGILFLDEMNTAPTQVQAALFQLVLGGKLGDYTLPPGWVIIAAGNAVSDRAAAQRMPTALRNRFAHIYVVADVNAWAKWATANNIAPEFVAFARFRRELFDDTRGLPVGDENAFLTFRSFTRASEYAYEDVDVRQELIGTHVGDDSASEIEGFIRLYQSLGSLEDIVRDPENAKLPTEASERYAVATGLARLATRKNWTQIMKYTNRLDGERQRLLVHDATIRDPSLKETTAYSQWAIKHQDMIMQ